MTVLGKQFIIDLHECDANLVNDAAYIEHHLATSAATCGANIIKSVFHAFAPHGITGIIAIAESHISIHTWPEHAYATVDVFCCNDKIDIETLELMLKEAFKAAHTECRSLDRGILKTTQVHYL